MTLLFVDGFDAQDSLLKWVLGTGGNGFSADTGVTPWGVGASLHGVRVASRATLRRPVTPSSKVIVGMMFATTANFGDTFVVLAGDSGATSHLLVAADASGNGVVNLYRGTTLIASSAAGIIPLDGAFRFVEMSATIDDTAGTCVVKVNGTTVINFTGDTRNGGTSTNIDSVGIFPPTFNGSSGTGHWFDDLYVCNDQGSVNNTFLGSCRVQTLLPNGAGSSTQFTPVSGANYTNVNDVPDNTATYVSDTVSGHRDTYAMDDLDAGTDLIYGVQQCMHARQIDSGTGTIKQAQKSGATVSYGSTKTLGPSNGLYTDVFETNPATSAAYTQSEVNALEIGAEVV